jgi:glycosyltransferase 2 family protein
LNQVDHDPRPVKDRSRLFARLRQLAALLALAAFLAVIFFRFAELERVKDLMLGVRPGWLTAALGLQMFSFVCTPLLWWLVVRRAGGAPPLPSVLGLSYVKVFVDHVLPSGGVSGSTAVVRALVRRGVPRPVAVAAILADFISYFLGYAVAVAFTLLLFRRAGRLDGLAFAVVGPFLIVAVTIPVTILRLISSRRGPLTSWLMRYRPVARFVSSVEETPSNLVRHSGSLGPGALLRLLVFVLNGATLHVLLMAVGHPVGVGVGLAAVVMGSLVTTIGPLPGGLGSYETASVGTLVLFGVPTEEALAATLLLRGLNFWLPMLPGYFLLRYELKPLPASPGDDS